MNTKDLEITVTPDEIGEEGINIMIVDTNTFFNLCLSLEEAEQLMADIGKAVAEVMDEKYGGL
jgi:hypothetical protein